MAKATGQEIKCNVMACKYNDKSDCCTLSSICIGETNSHPTKKTDTDCTNFEINQ